MADTDIDRNLLFAVIAFQDDLIDQDRFVDVCAGWAARMRQPLADLLLERGWISEADRIAIDRKVERKVQKHGGARASLAALAGAEARDAIRRVEHPEIRKSLSSLPPASGHVLVETIVPPHRPEQSRYTLTRMHARGGLGRVWLAHDGDLRREVALKEILPERAANPETWRRFLKEAQVTGQLEHPNIVPVYELARRREDDQPFYVMRFVRGQSLLDALRDFHRDRAGNAPELLALQGLLAAFLKVCDAVAYAHSRGVVHRDLKPENIVLGAFGEVIVLDWGLAKLVDQPDDPGESGTRSLDRISLADDARTERTQGQMGTPCYMAPEQVDLKHDLVGDRTDVYALGGILFEILTGHPPAEGTTTAEVFERIKSGRIPLARQLKPDVPRPLEAICARAHATDRAGRYASVKDLADDVRRWIADEPVSAYRERSTERLGRWIRQHRTWARAVLVSMVTVTLVSVTAAVVVQQALGRERDARQRGQQEGARAEENFRLAQNAVDEYLTRVSENRLLRSPLPGMQPLRKELLLAALDYHRRFIAQQPDDPRVRALLAQAYFNAGRIQDEAGTKAEAVAYYQQAVPLYEGMAKARPGDPEAWTALATCLHRAGLIKRDAGQTADALATFDRASDLLNRAAAIRTNDPESLSRLAAVLRSRGVLLKESDRENEALDCFREAARLLEGPARLPGGTEAAYELANALIDVGILHAAYDRCDEALKALSESCRILEGLAREVPADVMMQAALASAYNNTGIVLDDNGRPEEALAMFRKALAIRERLARENPAVERFRFGQAMSHTDIGLVFCKLGPRAEALKAFGSAREIQEVLVANNPGFAKYHCQLATTLMHIGDVQCSTDSAEALRTWERALFILDELARADRPTVEIHHQLARVLTKVGDARLDLGRPDEAMKAYERARAVYEAQGSKEALLRIDYAHLLGCSADAQTEAGRPWEAISLLKKAETVLRAQLAINPGRAKGRSILGATLVSLGKGLWSVGRAAEALTRLEDGRRLLEAVCSEEPGSSFEKGHLANAYRALGVLHHAEQRPQVALGALRRACDLRASYSKGPAGHYNLACDLALYARVAGECRAGPENEEAVHAADQAAAALTRAVQGGYGKARRLINDPDLATIRSRSDVQALLLDLSFPSDVFAPDL